jgi:hypothetical protein
MIRALGGPATQYRFVRTNVNKKYFRYQIQVERGGSTLIENINGDYCYYCRLSNNRSL